MLQTKNALSLIAGLSIFAAMDAAATPYTFQTLDNNADPTFNQLLGINNSGNIAGYFGSGAAGHPNQGYTLASPYGQANYTNENFPGSTQTQVTGLNNNGTTVGFYVDALNNSHGFFDVGGIFTTVDNPLTTGAVLTNQLLAVNNSNAAAGFYLDAAGNAHGEIVNLGINSAFSPVIINGAVDVTAAGINNTGVIAGFYTNAAAVTLGFILNGSTLTSLQDPNGVSTMVLGLNNLGLADGTYTDAGGVTHGFVYDIATGKFTTVDDPNGANGTTLNGLNDRGQLTGFFVDANGNTHGLLANVIPEPSSIALLALGLASLLGLRRRSGLSRMAM